MILGVLAWRSSPILEKTIAIISESLVLEGLFNIVDFFHTNTIFLICREKCM